MNSRIYKEILHAHGNSDEFLDDVVSEVDTQEQVLKVFVIDDDPLELPF